jgi:hypothetical protein
MHRDVVAVFLGQSVPLAAGVEAEDDAVEGRTQVDAGLTAMALGRRRGLLQEDGSIRSQRSVSTSQMVFNGLTSRFVRAKAASPEVAPALPQDTKRIGLMF